jgi:RND superfamily putative drug exporter
LTDYLQEMDMQFRGSAAGGFYLPQRAFADPRLRAALDTLISKDGRATYLLVYGNGQEWSGEGAARAQLIETAVREGTKEGTLTPTAVHVTGIGPTNLDLQALVQRDMTLLLATTLALIFLIVALMLRSPVAGIVVVGTVAMSYASALGASILIWQHLLGHDLHWSVAPISFIALVAVGADYNLLLAMRIREEAGAGLSTGIVRAFAATGGVVTTAGIVFGITMFALAGSSILSIAQIGTTVGVGLLLDTLIVRTFVLPSLIALLGRWFWWPRRLARGRRFNGLGRQRLRDDVGDLLDRGRTGSLRER